MNNNSLEKTENIILYVIIYTAVFMFLSLTMPYIFPFVLGALIALIAQYPIRLITSKFRIKRSIAGLIVVLVIFLFISAVITAIIAKIISELISLSSMLPDIIDSAKSMGYKYLDIAVSYYEAIDPAIVESIKELANKIFSGSFTAAMVIINSILDVVKSLPGILMVILFTLLSSIYMAIDLPKIKDKVFSLFSREDSSRAKRVILETNKMLGHYMSAYIILMSITFIETYIGTSILRLKYAVLISAITSISDLLPVLGPGTVLIPTGIVYMIGGDYVKGTGLLVIYLVTLFVRQILEPKILSTSLGIHPLALIAAIFIGLKAHGLAGMIFTVFLVIFYVILHKVGLL